jgi:hypothetical protein
MNLVKLAGGVIEKKIRRSKKKQVRPPVCKVCVHKLRKGLDTVKIFQYQHVDHIMTNFIIGS